MNRLAILASFMFICSCADQGEWSAEQRSFNSTAAATSVEQKLPADTEATKGTGINLTEADSVIDSLDCESGAFPPRCAQACEAANQNRQRCDAKTVAWMACKHYWLGSNDSEGSYRCEFADLAESGTNLQICKALLPVVIYGATYTFVDPCADEEARKNSACQAANQADQDLLRCMRGGR